MTAIALLFVSEACSINSIQVPIRTCEVDARNISIYNIYNLCDAEISAQYAIDNRDVFLLSYNSYGTIIPGYVGSYADLVNFALVNIESSTDYIHSEEEKIRLDTVYDYAVKFNRYVLQNEKGTTLLSSPDE